MKIRIAPALAAPQLDDEQTIPDDLVGRLYGANEVDVADVMVGYSSSQRANLAMFFYRKAHLRPIGLAIAATCDFSTLVQVWGPARGEALFDQSHDCTPAPATVRPKITLARFPTSHLCPGVLPDADMTARIAA